MQTTSYLINLRSCSNVKESCVFVCVRLCMQLLLLLKFNGVSFLCGSLTLPLSEHHATTSECYFFIRDLWLSLLTAIFSPSQSPTLLLPCWGRNTLLFLLLKQWNVKGSNVMKCLPAGSATLPSVWTLLQLQSDSVSSPLLQHTHNLNFITTLLL